MKNLSNQISTAAMCLFLLGCNSTMETSSKEEAKDVHTTMNRCKRDDLGTPKELSDDLRQKLEERTKAYQAQQKLEAKQP
jgi:hypothetical protein